MQDISVEVEKKNGEPEGLENRRHRINFSGWKIVCFKIPNEGQERVGSVGIDFDLYLTSGGCLLLIVENWSRRPAGSNFRVFETFDSVEEMESKVIYENSYTVEVPAKLIRRAKKELRNNGYAGPETLPHEEQFKLTGPKDCRTRVLA